MNKIDGYEALVAERKRLEHKISNQKMMIMEEFMEIKSKVQPFLNLLPFLNMFQKKESSHPVLKFFTSAGIDLVGHRLLSKTGWLTRLILPIIAKGISSQLLRSKTSEINHQPKPQS